MSMAIATPDNPLGLRGLEFIEFASPRPEELGALFQSLGFSRLRLHHACAVEGWQQNDIRLLVDRTEDSYAASFRRLHGPCVSALGLRVADAQWALAEAVRRGARPYQPAPGTRLTLQRPAIYGIGDSLVYFVDRCGEESGSVWTEELGPHPQPLRVPQRGFLRVDHLTNNVYRGTLGQWADFYKRVFGFTEVRHFDIRGERTGLYSFALQSPCKSFSIPINEGTESKSQIEEYLREYQGPGVQHIALLSEDLLGSLELLAGQVPLLDIEPSYYATAFQRVPHVRESRERLRAHQVLVDGDESGYLLQIFTRNVVGPIFFELIQRHNHQSFGEGNFGALFRSLERDQERRGVL